MHSQSRKHSSVGSEHLPYKQRVRGSSPCASTENLRNFGGFLFLYILIYSVYILFSSSLNKYYIGFTADTLEERLRKHNSNHKGFTGGKGDWTIKYAETYSEKITALKREKEIKAKKSRKYIETLIAQSV